MTFFRCTALIAVLLSAPQVEARGGGNKCPPPECVWDKWQERHVIVQLSFDIPYTIAQWSPHEHCNPML